MRHESFADAAPGSFEGRASALLAACDPQLIALLLPVPVPPSIAGLLRFLRSEHPHVPVLVAMEGGRPEDIFELLQLGVADYLTPPLAPAQVLPRVWRILARGDEAGRLKEKLKESYGPRQLLGESPAFRDAMDRVRLVARWDVSVLLCGETGTGKDMCGRVLHYLSPRARRSYVAVNCGAVPVELMENELFGHERAAFTGAAAAAPGLVHEAEGGTLFLDEVDALSSAAQVKLLRFLQEKEYRPLGSARTRRADVRILAATNTDPDRAVEQGRLRRDLYYRLNVIQVRLPPLRERPGDVHLLARHFLTCANQQFGRSIPGFAPSALEALDLHDWPGNVRELAHVVERAVLLRDAPPALLKREHLDLGSVAAPQCEAFREAKARTIAEFERRYVSALLRAHSGNVTRAARAAGKDRKSFWELIRNHRIDVEGFRAAASSKARPRTPPGGRLS